MNVINVQVNETQNDDYASVNRIDNTDMDKTPIDVDTDSFPNQFQSYTRSKHSTVGLYPSDTCDTANSNKNINDEAMNTDTKEYTGFYKTKPAWMSNVNWCWHREASELASGSYKALGAENASEIGLEQSCAMKDSIESVQAIMNKYSH